MQVSIQNFENHLRDEGKARKTIQSYLADIRSFSIYLEAIGVSKVSEIKRQHIVTYRQYLLDHNYRPATINKALNSLHSYTNWIIYTGGLPSQEPLVRHRQDRIKIASGSEGSVEILSEAEIGTLLNYLDSSEVSKRDKLIVYFLLYTGTRVGEICSTKISDLDLLTGQLKIIGKGGKYREIPLRPDLVKLIQDYLKGERSENKLSNSPYLFISQRAETLNRDTINTILEKVGTVTNLRLYPHKFRHTFCTRLITAGVPITTVSKLAGHAGVDTTARYYVNISRKDKENAVNML